MGFVEGNATLKLASFQTAEATDDQSATGYNTLMTSAIERRNYFASELGQLGQPLAQSTPSAIRFC